MPEEEVANSQDKESSVENPQIKHQSDFVLLHPDQVMKGSPANLHPLIRPLTVSDLDSVEALENAAFTDPNERATREKLKYRLTKCGELCLGVFATITPESGVKAETLATGRPVETSRTNGAISVLLGHVIAAKTDSETATDESMDYPRDWDSSAPAPSKSGHVEEGRTIVLHSVATLPGFQGRGLGQILMKSYMQQMNGSGLADRLVLIAHDYNVSWYEKLGWTTRGKSDVTFGSGDWSDMIYELKPVEARATYTPRSRAWLRAGFL